MRMASTKSDSESPLGHSHAMLGTIDPSGASPAYTFTSAMTAKASSTSSSMPSSAYCIRADTSMPR